RTSRSAIPTFLADGSLNPDAPVFRSRNGVPLGIKQVWRIVRRAAIEAGLTAKVSPHWLRHAHASHALDRGAPIHLVRDSLGHSSIATTNRYLHARPTEHSERFLTL
ncbi:MAG: tyrosine-type recombinase/integrase, partial [Chloroflexi bacterium]|nr:tyrosine-type recombinase/integrase [Chloroflexota bacterium]